MTSMTYKVRFWGVRGSVPTPTAENLRYGGNTSCVAVDLGDRRHLILDCGTGIRQLGDHLTEGKPRLPMQFDILFSHYHLDHVEGLPFFSPLYDPSSTIAFHGFESAGRSVKEILETLLAPPYFPVPLAKASAKVSFVTLDGSPLQFGPIGVSMLPLNHPNGSLSYRLEYEGRKIIYATDHEHGVAATDSGLVRFSERADYLIYDAMYVPSEYETARRGWGHSTWYEAVRIAAAARVKTLVLFHHHPRHTDAELEKVLEAARSELPHVEIAAEGLELPL